jgi:hypothetical protein
VVEAEGREREKNLAEEGKSEAGQPTLKDCICCQGLYLFYWLLF